MEVRVEDRNAAKVVLVKGDVDIRSSHKLRKALLELTSKKHPRIVISFKEMPYIDSSGVATLLECFKEMQKYKGELRLADLTTSVREVFRLMHLDTVFRIFPDAEAALAG